MAKTSMVERDKRRARTVAKVRRQARASSRSSSAARSTSDEERAEAQVQLQKLPRDASPSRGRNRCKLTGPSTRRVPQVRPGRAPSSAKWPIAAKSPAS